MHESTACPHPEVLAAFIDGRLPKEDRRRVMAHLDACEECYEIFSETVRFQGEEEPRGRVVESERFGGVERFGERRWVWAAAAVAAVLLVLVAVPVLRMEPERPVVATLPTGGDASLSAEALVSAIDVADGQVLAGALRPGRPGGGLGFAPKRVSADTASFRAGVWLVGLRAAARAEDARAAEDAVRELAAALEATGAAAGAEEPLGAASDAAREGRIDELGGAADELEAHSRKRLQPFPLALGQWAEAGRLAAALGDEGFFLSAPFTRFLGEIGDMDLPEEESALLADVEALTADGAVDEAELAELETLFKDLTARY